MPSRTSSSLDLNVLRPDIADLSNRCRHFAADAGGLALSMAKSHWHGALCSTHELYTRPRVLKERWREERTGSRSLNFFQAVFTPVVVESS